MGVLGRWGVWVIVPEAVLGGVAYTIMASPDVDTSVSISFGLFIAGIVASFLCIVLAIVGNQRIGVAVATASLAVIFAIFCALSRAPGFALLLIFLGGVLVKSADFLVKKG